MRPEIVTNEQSNKSREKEILFKELREPQRQNLSPRQQIRRLRYSGRFAMSIVLTSVGGISLLFSYLYSSSILTFIGLGLTLWGALIFYLTRSRYVPEEIIKAMPLSMIQSIDTLVTGMGYKGRTIFLHPQYLKGFRQGYVFIPQDCVFRIPNDEQLAKEKIFYDDPRGIFIIAPSQSLVELFEKELNVSFATVDLSYVKETLPKLLIEDLRIIDKLSIENSDDMIHAKIVGRSFARLCNSVSKETVIGSHLGCPLCAAIALVISKTCGKPVIIEQNTVTQDTIETTYKRLDG